MKVWYMRYGRLHSCKFISQHESQPTLNSQDVVSFNTGLIFCRSSVTYWCREQSDLIQLQLTRISPGLRCVNNIIETIEMRSVKSCIIYGMSINDCHAVNYNTKERVCEVIVSHGVVMQVKDSIHFHFASFNYECLQTGVEVSCDQSVVQWKEQFA